MADIPDGSTPPDFTRIGAGLADGLESSGFTLKNALQWQKVLQVGLTNVVIALVAVIGKVAATIIRGVAQTVKIMDPAFGEVAKAGIEAVFDVSVPASSFADLTDKGARESAKKQLGVAMMTALTGVQGDGSGGDITPSLEPAEKYLGLIAGLAVEGWLMGIAVELESLNYLEHFGDLKDTVANVFGLGRLTRRVLGPIIDATIVSPTKWKINSVYRPTHLGVSTLARQVARGRMTHDELFAELAQEGYTDQRIEALLNEAARFLSMDQAMLLVRGGEWTEDHIIEDLKNQGWDEGTAQLVLRAFKENRLLGIHDNIISAATSAYAARDIEEPQFRKIVTAVVPDQDEQQAYLDVAGARRELTKKHLSHAEVKQAVKDDILAFVDYRLWLDREAYPPDEAVTLELLLRKEKNDKADLEDARKKILAARDQAAADKLAAAQAKKAAVDAQRALARRGSLADLDRAAVRGLIPFSRVEEVLGAQYDPDTVSVLLSLLEADRQKFLAQQQAAADALQRASIRHIDLAQLDAGVMEGVLTIDYYKAQLASLKFSDTDIEILAATLAAKLADQQHAAQLRADAQAKAAVKHIDLPRLELLVRRGHRTIGDYRALLSTLGYDDGSIAAMVDLLQLKIADDAKAADARAYAAAHPPAKDLTLDQMRTAVILGTKTRDDYQRYLLQQKFTADDQIVLLAELDDAVTTAVAARKKRDAGGGGAGSPQLTLSRIAQAARLGLIDPTVYQARLIDAGYSDDDIAIEMDLLVTEIADTQAARARRDALAAASIDKGLSLSQLQQAILKGVQPIDVYQTRALQLGYSADDVQTLVGVLSQELIGQTDALARRADVAKTLAAQSISLDQIEAAVRAGSSTVATYQATLETMGVDPLDAELLGSLLSGELTGGAHVA